MVVFMQSIKKRCGIGILDSASLEGMRRLSRLMWGITKGTHVPRDQDHFSVLMRTLQAWPNERAAADPPRKLFEYAQTLKAMGADFFVIPHQFPPSMLGRLQKGMGAPLITLDGGTIEEMLKRTLKKAGDFDKPFAAEE